MLRRFLIITLCAAAIIACQTKDDSLYEGSLERFEVSLSRTNLLRGEVAMRFSAPTEFQIEYWERADSDLSSLQQTQRYEGNGVVRKTLLFLKPNTEYACRIRYGNGLLSDVKYFKTQSIQSITQVPSLNTDEIKEPLAGYLLFYNWRPGYLFLSDTKGTILWYEPVSEGLSVANYDAKTQHFYLLTTPTGVDKFAYNSNKVKVIDLFGKVLWETDLTTLPQMKGRTAHHECRPLPDGGVALVTYVDKPFDLTARGGTASETVKGDGYVILNKNGKFASAWDCFSTLNPADDPDIMNTKGDWLHANSFNYDSEGNYYMTFNAPSELWKIDARTGKVLYRVGKKGTIVPPASGIANGMHCANPQAPDDVLVLDNARAGTSIGTRALRYKVNAITQTVEVTLNCEIPKEMSSGNRSNVQLFGKDMLLFASTVKSLILFTDRSPKAKILRSISLGEPFYRVEYIPEIRY